MRHGPFAVVQAGAGWDAVNQPMQVREERLEM